MSIEKLRLEKIEKCINYTDQLIGFLQGDDEISEKGVSMLLEIRKTLEEMA